jgi:hypothetical protein
MTNPIIKIIDLSTNEAIEREMTNAEFADLMESKEKTEQFEASAIAKESAKSALLDRLGITADEAALLLS